MDAARRFFRDWGLNEKESAGDAASFATETGAEIVLRPAAASSLPPAFETGSTLREVIWGVETQDDLDRLVERLAKTSSVAAGKDGNARCIDPNGLGVGLRVS